MPEVPALPRASGLTPAGSALARAVEGAFAETGALPRAVAGYEPREGQRRMAAAVAGVLDEGGTLLAEAGTGTGKTVAYLVPAILSGHRLLVSTGTKNLQEQIYFKDLPVLREALGIPFTATLMKGRANYLCLHRWDLQQQAADPSTGSGLGIAHRDILLPVIADWAATTETGDRAELHDLPEDLPFWKSVAAEADTCLGTKCPRYDDCFITRMRQRAASSDIVIVNHHLLCADAAVRHGAYGEVIPSTPALVIDEAHQLEDVATQYFGYAVSNFRLENLVRDGERLLAASDLADMHRQEVMRGLTRVFECSRAWFSRFPLTEVRIRYDAAAMEHCFEEGMMLAGALEALDTTLGASASGAGQSPPLDTLEALAALQRRATELRGDIRLLMRASDPDFVYFLEVKGRSIVLKASPIDVSRLIGPALLDRARTTVLTSATLAVDDSFEYVKGRLGLRSAQELRVPSEFDYASQALLYLPRRVPPPKTKEFAEAAARETVEILARSRGRAFVLFTSYSVLHTVQRMVEMSLPYPVLVQGSAPRTQLIERFRNTPNAVLLATSSFWQGVDVVGEALSCVIIDKLPFASPGDPVTAARIDAINAAGGDAFADYQVPLAILTLQQGLGRLIRHRTDRGVLAILDPRLRSMGYGRRFLASLPPAPVTHELDAVARFFM